MQRRRHCSAAGDLGSSAGGVSGQTQRGLSWLPWPGRGTSTQTPLAGGRRVNSRLIPLPADRPGKY